MLVDYTVAYISITMTMIMAMMIMMRTMTTPIMGAISPSPLSSLLSSGGGGSIDRNDERSTLRVECLLIGFDKPLDAYFGLCKIKTTI